MHHEKKSKKALNFVRTSCIIRINFTKFFPTKTSPFFDLASIALSQLYQNC